MENALSGGPVDLLVEYRMPGHGRSVAGIKCARVRRTDAGVLSNGKVHLVPAVSAVGLANFRGVRRNVELHLAASPTAVVENQS
jgi:hypothetical protein